jgi:isoamylase
MLLGNDESRRTHRGNNSDWCQDNGVSWSDWSLLERHSDIHCFLRGLIALRRAHPVLSREIWHDDAEIRFFVPQSGQPGWNAPDAKSVGVLIPCDEFRLCLLFNAASETADFVLPVPPTEGRWQLAADTFRTALAICTKAAQDHFWSIPLTIAPAHIPA